MQFLIRVLLLLGGFIVALGFTPPSAFALDKQEEVVRKLVRFNLTVRNPKERVLEGESVLVYAPANTSNQTVVRLESSYPYQLTTDGYGNQLMSFLIAQLPPHAALRISVTATLDMPTQAQPISLETSRDFFQPEAFVESDAPEIQEMAKRLNQAADPEHFVDQVYEWVSHRMSYAGFVAEDLGALSAFRTGYGDCSEYAYLVAALSRAAGFPARVMGGFVTPSNAVLKANEYHNWTEVFVDGKWHLVDAQKRVLRSPASDYVSTRVVVRNTSGREPSPFFHRYFSPGGVLEVVMD